MLVVGICSTVIAFITLISTESYNVMIASIFSMGLLATPRLHVSTILLFELMQTEKWTLAYALICVFGEGLSGLVPAIYFIYVSKNWYWLMVGCTVNCSISAFGTYFILPESPKFLISTGQLEKAH